MTKLACCLVMFCRIGIGLLLCDRLVVSIVALLLLEAIIGTEPRLCYRC